MKLTEFKFRDESENHWKSKLEAVGLWVMFLTVILPAATLIYLMFK